jgi:hypothetical protein
MKSRVMISSLSAVVTLMGVCGLGGASSGFKFSSVSGSRINLLESHQQTETWGREKTYDFGQNNETIQMIKREDVFREKGVWEPPWWNGYSKDHTLYHNHSSPNEQRDEEERENAEFSEGVVEMSYLSKVKLIPDEHHVSAFLHKGVTKR